ncbi:MAG: DMT family transporter [bacterium]|nr:DMT family transporter [bacterium]
MFRSIFNAALSNATLILSLTALFWAGNFVVGRGMHENIPPLAMATVRWFLAALIFSPFAIKHLRHDWPTIKCSFGVIFLLGLLGVGCFNSFAYIGLNHTTALNGLIMQSAGPVLILLGALFLYGEKINNRQIMGICISLVGVLVIVSKAVLGNLLALSLNKGDFWILAAMSIWALYTLLLRKRPDIHPVSFLAVTFWIGAIVNIPFFVWEHLNIRQLQITPESIVAIYYISVFPSIVAYLFYNRGVALIGAAKAGMFLHLVPMFGSVLAIIFLGEQLHLYHALGFGLILLGVTTAVRS